MTTITTFAHNHLNVSDGRPFSLKDSLQQIQKIILTPSFLTVGRPWFFLSLMCHALHSFILLFVSDHTTAHQTFNLLINLTDLFISASVSVAWYRLLAFQIDIPRLSFGKEERRFLFGYLSIGAIVACYIMVMIGLFGTVFHTLTNTPLLMTSFAKILTLLWASLSFFFLTPLIHLFLGLLGIGIPMMLSFSYALRLLRPILMRLSIGYSLLSLFLGGFSVGTYTLLTMISNTIPNVLLSFSSIFINFLSVSVLTIFTSHILYQRCIYRRDEEEKSLS